MRYVHIDKDIRTYMYIVMLMYTHIYVLTYIHIRTYIYIYTHINDISISIPKSEIIGPTTLNNYVHWIWMSHLVGPIVFKSIDLTKGCEVSQVQGSQQFQPCSNQRMCVPMRGCGVALIKCFRLDLILTLSFDSLLHVSKSEECLFGRKKTPAAGLQTSTKL